MLSAQPLNHCDPSRTGCSRKQWSAQSYPSRDHSLPKNIRGNRNNRPGTVRRRVMQVLMTVRSTSPESANMGPEGASSTGFKRRRTGGFAGLTPE